jgi:NodT family efflux transporter outer membrane factor (OMF) lipoprotein
MLGQWRLSRIGSVAATVLLLANCAVGPDFQQPAAPDVTGYAPQPLAEQTSSADVKGGEAQRLVQDLDIPGQWWTLFHSAALNALVEQALKNNPSLPAAEAALRQAWENVYAAEGAFFPTAVASYSPSRNKTATGVTFTSASSGSPFFTLHTAQVVVTYAPDVFGGTRRQVESLAATTEFQRFQLEAAYLTLTSNVVAAAVQEASLRGQIAATEEIIKIETQSLGILRKQLELGQVAGADVAAVEATLAQAQVTLSPLQKQLAVQRDLLTALIGRLPSQEPAEKFELASLQLLQDLPVSLPSKLVEQRPDIQSAEAQLHAASAQIGVAIAAQLPQFTLTANAGTVANQIGQLFISAPGEAGVIQPVKVRPR